MNPFASAHHHTARRLRRPAGRTAIPLVRTEATTVRLQTAPDDRVLFVASTGGHLAQLHKLAAGLRYSPDSLWVTFDHLQSNSLLHDEPVRFVDYVPPRGWRPLARAFVQIGKTLRGREFDLCVTSGAGVALAALPWMRLRGVPCMFLESVSRTDGPSMTGRIVARTRLAETFTQHPAWADRTWRLHENEMASFAAVPRDPAPATSAPLKIFVTLGTIQPYRFDSLVAAVVGSGLASGSTVWQLGETTAPAEGLPGDVRQYIAADEFSALCEDADVVITHAGVGTVLELLEKGVHPVVVPRRVHRGEHVDDHQTQIAALLHKTGTATVCETDELDAEAIRRAAGLRTVERPRPEAPAPVEPQTRPLRVLQLTDNLELGGLQTVVVSLCHALADRGATVGMMAGGEGDEGQMWDRLPDEVTRLPLPRRTGVTAPVRFVARLRRTIRKGRWDVVHAHQRRVALFARIATIGTDAVVVEHVHNTFHAGRFSRLVSFRGHRLIACGTAIGRMLTDEFGRSPERVRVVTNGIDDVGRDRDLTLPGQAGRLPRIVAVGRLVEQKDPLRFVAIIRALNRDGVVAEAEWVGDGPLRAEVAAALAADPVPGLAFTGHSDDVAGKLADADLLLLTSRWEGLPLVVLEAMALGRGVVTPAVGSCPDVVVPDVNGLLLDTDEIPAATAERLHEVLDPQTLGEWGRQSRKRYLETSTVAQMTDETAAVYAAARRRRRTDPLDVLPTGTAQRGS